jgi:hypothetical protein
MQEKTHQRIESIIVILMIIGIIAMFQPWFVNIFELFEPLAPEADLGRLYKDDIAPSVLRYGFYITMLSTIAFIVFSHYSLEELERAYDEKGKTLTSLLIAMPVISGFSVLGTLSASMGWSALVYVFGFICSIALWHSRRWGLMGLIAVAVIQLGLLAIGKGLIIVTVFFTLTVVLTLILTWPRRTMLK